jgi:hypothetical protein
MSSFFLVKITCPIDEILTYRSHSRRTSAYKVADALDSYPPSTLHDQYLQHVLSHGYTGAGQEPQLRTTT